MTNRYTFPALWNAVDDAIAQRVVLAVMDREGFWQGGRGPRFEGRPVQEVLTASGRHAAQQAGIVPGAERESRFGEPMANVAHAIEAPMRVPMTPGMLFLESSLGVYHADSANPHAAGFTYPEHQAWGNRLLREQPIYSAMGRVIDARHAEHAMLRQMLLPIQPNSTYDCRRQVLGIETAIAVYERSRLTIEREMPEAKDRAKWPWGGPIGLPRRIEKPDEVIEHAIEGCKRRVVELCDVLAEMHGLPRDRMYERQIVRTEEMKLERQRANARQAAGLER